MIYLDPHTSTVSDADDPQAVPCHVSLDRGSLWAMIRAVDKATFDAQALSVGLKVYANPAQPEVLDDEGNVLVEAVPASGPLIPAPGITITEIGAHVLTPSTYDDEGNQITAPLLDDRHHVNFWLAPHVVARGEWTGWALAWTFYGDDLDRVNAAEQGSVYQGIELIDPDTVVSPSNVLL